MNNNFKTVEEYLNQLSDDRKEAMQMLRKSIQENLPEGFEEVIQYNMITYVVPKSIYPKGYHTTPDMPLPFLSIASQKNHIALYHLGIYANPDLLRWFTEAFPTYSKVKLDMGKSCIRFKNAQSIPFDLLGQLFTKMSVTDWVKLYENQYVKK